MKFLNLNKKLFMSSFMFFLLNLVSLTGSAKGFGLGVMLFGPTAISVQDFFDSSRSLDGALGWDFNKTSEIYLHSTYLLHKPNQFHIESYSFNLFYGVGAFIHSKKTNSELGSRFAVGSAYNAKSVPVEGFAELVANLNLVPRTDVLLSIGLGGRYYF
jgi:hypothetical protein